ncbi:MAG: ATP-grasp domain-containing protein, partial [Gaiellales bacterium]
SSEDAQGVLEIARDADGLIAPGTDWPVRVAAEVAQQLGLPHPLTASVARVATDKIAQRAALQAAGVPQPAWSTDGPPGFPCVVKAADRQGQRAMTIVGSPAELARAVERAREASRWGPILIEEFIPGHEVTVNGFCAGGRHVVVGVTDREHFHDAPGVARRHVYPALDGGAAAAEVATAAVGALGIAQGPTYVQVMVGDDGPRIMEVAARLGGGHDSELLRRTTGVDLAAQAVRASLGWPVDPAALQPQPQCAGVVEFLRAPVGRLAAAEGPACARFYHSPGHVYGRLRIATDRAGYVLCTADGREEALASARSAVEHVRFSTR